MIPNCEGCEWEWEEACEMVEKGYYLATLAGRGVFDKGSHFLLIIVDDDGNWVEG